MYSTKRAHSDYLKVDKSTFVKILKFNNHPSLVQQKRNNLYTEKSIDIRSSLNQVPSKNWQTWSQTFSQSLVDKNENLNENRKSIEGKFQRTRLILKEEGRMQKQ